MDWITADLGVSLSAAAFLCLAAFVAGFVDAIAGGGGLINVPALMLAGLPPVAAIATNKLQGTFGVASSALTYWRAGRVEARLIPPLFGAAFVGGVAGAATAHLAPTDLLRLVIPFLLIGIALSILRLPQFSDEDATPRMGFWAFSLSYGLGIGFYDGIFGPGGGTFFFVGLVLLCGLGVMRAVAHTKLMNLASNLGALIFFALAGEILVRLGLAMGIASALGAYFGARATLRLGARIVRPFVVSVSVLMALRLMLDPGHPVGGWLRSALG